MSSPRLHLACACLLAGARALLAWSPLAWSPLARPPFAGAVAARAAIAPAVLLLRAQLDRPLLALGVPGRAMMARPLIVAALPGWLAVTAIACNGVTPPGQPTPTPPSETAFGRTAPRILTPAPDVSGDPNVGRRLLASKGCTGCHTIAGVPGATGVAGPNLTNVALRPTIAGESIPNSPDMLVRWLLDPPAVKPGTSMPRLGLTEQEARDLVAFLESQPHNAP